MPTIIIEVATGSEEEFAEIVHGVQVASNTYQIDTAITASFEEPAAFLNEAIEAMAGLNPTLPKNWADRSARSEYTRGQLEVLADTFGSDKEEIFSRVKQIVDPEPVTLEGVINTLENGAVPKGKADVFYKNADRAVVVTATKVYNLNRVPTTGQVNVMSVPADSGWTPVQEV